MRGLEYRTILMVIVVAAVIFITILAAIIPVANAGINLRSDITFSEFCYQWGLRGYEEDWDTEIIRSGNPYGTPADHCPTDDVETCRNLCP